MQNLGPISSPRIPPRDGAREHAKLLRVQALASALARALTPEDVAEILVEEAAVTLGAELGVVYRVHGGRFEIVGHRGFTGRWLERVTARAVDRSSPAGRAALDGETVWLETPDEIEERFPGVRGELLRLGDDLRAIVCLPLRQDGRVLGVHAFGFSHERVFEPDERAFLETLAQLAASMLDRAQLFAAHEEMRLTLAAIVEASPLAITVLDLAGRVRMLNGAAERMFGWSAAEAIGEVLPTIPPERRDELRAYLAALASGEQFAGKEVVRRRRDGSSFEVAVWSARFLDGHGKPLVVSIAADISERKQADRLVAELNGRLGQQVDELRTLMSLIPIGIGIARDPECRRVEPNAYLASALHVPTTFNVAAREQLGADLYRVRQDGVAIGPDEMPMACAARTGKPQIDVELEIDVGDEPPRAVLTHAVPLFDELGETRGAIGAFVDVTDRKRAMERERFLSRATALLASSLDVEGTLEHLARLVVPHLGDGATIELLAEDGAFELRAAAHVVPELERALRALRATAKLPEDHPIVRSARTGEAIVLAQMTDEQVTFGAPTPSHAELLRSLRIRSAVLTPLVARGRTLGVLSLTSTRGSYHQQDVALARELASRAALALDNARLYREARDAVRVRDDFLSIASHELNTPLTSLKLALGHFARSGGVAPSHARMLATVERQADRLAQLVSELLDVSRITSGRLKMTPEPVDLREVVDEVAGRLAVDLRRSGSELELSLEGDLGGEWDRLRVDQVVTNLLSNAVKFGRGAPVSLSARRDGDRVRLSVRDRGIGIAPEDLARIFERFERAVATHHYGGFGLGLWIVRQIVDAMGGSVRVESIPGEGSSFTVELPVAAR